MVETALFLFSFYFAFAFKDIRRYVQIAKRQTVWLSLDCINGKYLWALPTPTTFEKVDQTFIIAWLNCELNHNLPNFKIILYFYEKTHCRGFQVRAKCLQRSNPAGTWAFNLIVITLNNCFCLAAKMREITLLGLL